MFNFVEIYRFVVNPLTIRPHFIWISFFVQKLLQKKNLWVVHSTPLGRARVNGCSHYILSFASSPVKNPVLIYKCLFRYVLLLITLSSMISIVQVCLYGIDRDTSSDLNKCMECSEKKKHLIYHRTKCFCYIIKFSLASIEKTPI